MGWAGLAPPVGGTKASKAIRIRSNTTNTRPKRVQHVANCSNGKSPTFPPAAALGLTWDVEGARDLGAIIGKLFRFKGANVLVVGIAYKPNVDDIREAPAATIIDDLIDRGAAVQYHDPHIPEFPDMRKHDISLSSVGLTPDSLSGFDAVLIITDHDVT